MKDLTFYCCCNLRFDTQARPLGLHPLTCQQLIRKLLLIGYCQTSLNSFYVWISSYPVLVTAKDKELSFISCCNFHFDTQARTPSTYMPRTDAKAIKEVLLHTAFTSIFYRILSLFRWQHFLFRLPQKIRTDHLFLL